MKTLYLIRHAKSSWKFPELADFDRPLNNRGKRDAPFMGKLLKDDNILPELILSSPAKRALKTAEKIAKEIGYPEVKIHTHKRLYEPDTDDFINVIKQIDQSVQTLMIFSHNPGLTVFNNYLADKRIDNIPTTGIVRIELNIEHWKNIDYDCGKLLSFDFPKKYLPKNKQE